MKTLASSLLGSQTGRTAFPEVNKQSPSIELGQVVLLYVSHELPGDVFWETGGPCQILSLSGYGIHRRAKGYGVFARGFFESNIHSSLQRFSVPSSYALKTVTLTCPVIIPRIFMDPMDKYSHNRKVILRAYRRR